VPGLTRPAFTGETPLFLYHPQTETVTKSGSEVTAVTGTSSPNMVRGATGPLEVTDALGRKFWRFRGTNYLEIAVGDITFTPRALTIIMVGRQHVNSGNCQFFGQSYQADGVTLCAFNTAMFHSYGTSGAAPHLRAGTTNSNATGTGATHMAVGSQMQVFGIGGRSAANGGSRFVMNNVAVNGSESSIFYTGMKGARIGSYAKAPSAGNPFDLYAIVGIAGELSNARIDAVAAALVSAYQIPAITDQIIFEGDSITYGTGLGTHENIASYMTNPGAELLPKTTRVFNFGVSGATIATMTTRRDVAGGFPVTVLPGGASKNLVAFQIGRNNALADSGATMASGITNYINQATTGLFTRGFNAVVGVNISSNNATIMTNYTSLRSLLRDASFLTGLDAQTGGANEGRVNLVSLDLIESGGSQRFNTAAQAADVTYFQGDGTHPTAVGAALMCTGGTTPTYGWGSIL
jgi:hypothetical protein